MVELLAPGVYPIETSFRAASIQGAGTSTTGFAGITRSGPRGGPPRLVTSFAEYERLFGGLSPLQISGLDGAPDTNYLALSVRGFFNEGGSRLYVAPAFLAAAGSSGHSQAVFSGAADTDARHLILRSRFPGSASNGEIRLNESVTPSAPRALATAPIGALARSRGSAARAAAISADAAPGALTDGMTLAISVGGAAAQTVTFSGQPAIAQAAADIAANLDIPAGTFLVAVIDGLNQAVPIAAGQARARTAIRDEISARLTNGVCVLTGNRLAIRSASLGSEITVTVNKLDMLGFTAAQTQASGSGMRRLDRPNAADVQALFAAANIQAAVSTAPGSRLLRISSVALGNAASIDVSSPANAAALTALGFNPAALSTPARGADGVARRVFVRQSAAAAGWQEFARQGDGSWTASGGLADPAAALGETGHVATLGLSWTNADGVSVSYEGLGFDRSHPRWFGHRMAASADPLNEPIGDPLVLVTRGLNTAEIHAALFANARSDENDVLSSFAAASGGNDGSVPALMNYNNALERLNQVEDIAIVAAPGSSAYPALGDAVRNALIGHAQDSNFRIAVCDPPAGQGLPALRQTRGQIDNTYAAFYAPWIRVANPLARPGNDAEPRELVLPPSGHICGIYGRNDAARGVHKTPANEIIREATGFETEYNQRHQEVLNPIGINVLRYLPGRGNRVYGGRLATSDREIVYVSDRRYLNFIKHSLYSSMQWAVFEPNGPELWADVREAVSSFLFTQWRNGALLGGTPDIAYFVRCDRSVITQDDLDNGRLICEIGIAIVKPAEFLVFRIGQKTADSRS